MNKKFGNVSSATLKISKKISTDFPLYPLLLWLSVINRGYPCYSCYHMVICGLYCVTDNIVIYGYRWFCLSKINNGYAWFIHGYPWLSKVIHCYLLFIHGYQWLSVVILVYTWLSMFIHGFLWYMIIHVYQSIIHVFCG